MFAIISTGGKQYKVSENTVLTVSKLTGNPGDKITLDEVLFASDGKDFSLGDPSECIIPDCPLFTVAVVVVLEH